MFQIPPNLELEIEALPYVLHNGDLQWIGWPQPGGRLAKVANGRRKTNASRQFLRPAVYSFEQGCQMQSARTKHERVQLVNDNEIKLREKPLCVGGSPHKHRLDRLRRDEGDTAGVAHHFGFRRLGGVPVPTNNRNFKPLAQKVEPTKLVIDQRLERTDIEDREPWVRAIGDFGKDRQKGCFLARRGCRSDQNIVAAAQN